MISMWMVGALLITLAVVWVSSTPLFVAGADEQVIDRDYTQTLALMDEKERGLRAIKDLDLDFTMGKLSKEDFEQARASLSMDVARILNELKSFNR